MVLHVIDNLRAASGGPTTVVVELSVRQALAGRRVCVLFGEGPDDEDERLRLISRFKTSGVHFVQVGHLSLWKQRSAIRRCFDSVRPSVVHLHCVWESILRRAHAEAHRRSIDTVMSTHGTLHPFALAQKSWKKSLYLKLCGGIVTQNQWILTLNEEERLFASERFGVRARVLPNAVDTTQYMEPSTGNFRARLACIAERPFVLFVGRLHNIKGIDLLICAFHFARKSGFNYDLVIAGPDDGAGRSLLRLRRRLSLDDCVHFVGPVWGADKLRALEECAIFAHRPRFEGFGIAVAEAMAAGRPVVTTRRCMLDGAADSGALVLADDDHRSFGEALLRLSESPSTRREVGALARRWVEDHLSWSRVLGIVNESYGV
jgi:glycosyltransferase involved in cell wall biosynthesis